ncbi:MAG: pyruvate:ferredoxin (flavodoxin) oxidoreductase [Bacilli bacterium]|nr:pyruvate:ferredoxin (flavodoxin) oxidoreductase [Bacilli bacterium]
MKKIVDGNNACANVAYIFSEIASIYPITPSSPMASEIDNLANSSDKKNLFNEKVSVVEMQSEAGAAGTLHGALISGSLATTFTASQGLLLMIPNMYKIAGEGLPGVIHVAARTIATHALSIFGDHSDVYSTRGTGFAILASTNVFDAQNLAAVAHLSAIKASVPFLHFFDGFRTSHEINTIESIDENKLLKLIDYDAINEFKQRALNVNCKYQRGMAENEDIYFQSVEARNKDYDNTIEIVNNYMQEINKIMKTNYKPFNYYGDKKAEHIIVAMGSVCDTIKLVIDKLNDSGKKYGLIEVHLYRPFSSKYLLDVLPKTVKNIAVLDRVKESGSVGEPLYLDILSALKDKNINIVGGRYGLSSKNTTPQDIFSVYNMLETELKNNFTISIDDDITNLSLDKVDFEYDSDDKEVLIYGFGSDGMVSTSKDILKLVGNNTSNYVQGYFEYDSKKSGGITLSHLRIGTNPINKPFYVTSLDLLVITKDSYLKEFDMFDKIKENATVLINTSKESKAFINLIPDNVKKIINDKKLRVLLIDADKIALDNNIKGKISKIMEVIILKLLEYENALEDVSNSIKKQFKNKGQEIIDSNLNAINNSLDSIKLLSSNLPSTNQEMEDDNNIYDVIKHRRGYNLKVSDLIDFKNGVFPGGLTKNEKRATASSVAKWNSENCIECGMCSIVCPHAAIRPFVVDKNTPNSIEMIGNKEYNYQVLVSEADCLSCGLCINVCPGKKGNKALSFGQITMDNNEYVKDMFENYQNPKVLDKYTLKGSQLEKPKFEFSGACAGCGETPYLKLLTQLFGDKVVIANATGCSSIYGGSVPSTPYSVAWANSLFEDNAEFGYGIKLTYNKMHNRIVDIINNSIDAVDKDIKKLYKEYLDNQNDFDITLKISNELKDKDIPKDLKDLLPYMPARSVFIVGGDGWAYDIGFGGIDHVLSSGENVNIIVLDTEVYSNTGGQMSKSSHYGQVAEFANMGKRSPKKDLFKIAMNYPNCYVGSVSLGSNFMQTIKTFKEAENHDGPSIVICYSPCVEQGIKGGMCNATNEQKLAVDCGYVTLMHYNPIEEKLYIDSREPDFSKYKDFLMNEVRYRSLVTKNPELAKELLAQNIKYAKKRYDDYINIANK